MTISPRFAKTRRRLELVSEKSVTPPTRQDSAAEHALPAKGFFKTSDGVSLYFEDSGGVGTPLLYVYGLGCSIRHWKYSLAYFGDEELARDLRRPERGPHRRQIWLDLRGHGASQPPLTGQRLRIELITRDLLELCSYRGIKRVVLLGQSMGGSIALHMAHAHGDLVQSVILLTSPGRDPTDFLPLQPVSRYAWLGMIALNKRLPQAVRWLYDSLESYQRLPVISAASHLVFREVIRQNGFNPQLARTEDIEEYIQKFFSVRADLFYDMASDLKLFDIANYHPRIQAPALVIAGAKDQIIPLTEAKRLARHLPRGELAVVPHGSHCPHFDDPLLVNKLIEAFLSENSL